MITAAGSGYSRWGDLAVTRWREDPTRDDNGSYIFLRDVASGEYWSAGFQPSGAEPETYEVSFSEDRAEFVRRDGAITTRLEVIVSSEDDAEVRRVSVTNHRAAGARDRADFLRGDRPGAPRSGRRAPRVLQSVRPDRKRRGAGHPARDAPSALQ